MPNGLLVGLSLVGLGLEAATPARIVAQDEGIWTDGTAAVAPTVARLPGLGPRGTAGPESWTASHPAVPAALSLVVPGAGQLAIERNRGWVYLAMEALGWVAYAAQQRSGAHARDRYRDLAWDVARIGDGPRIEADFEYYERMTQWRSSGAFDRNPRAPGIQPEEDPSTFNGSIWERARGLFGVTPNESDPTDPSYQAALDYYTDRAYDEAFLWDWADQDELRDRYGALIEDSDEHFRNATVVLGALVANHLVSAVDALVTTRGMSVALAPTGGASWDLRMRWEWRP